MAKTESWGEACIPLSENSGVIRLYSQNLNGIFDREGLGLDEAFHTMRSSNVDIFAFTETHGDNNNAKSKFVMNKSTSRVWKSQGGFCTIATSSSQQPVKLFSESDCTMIGVTGNLCGRVRRKIQDEYGQWSGISLLGKDGREILILSAYDVSQNYATGYDTLYCQQRTQYLQHYNTNNLKCDKEKYIDPKKRFIKDLNHLLQECTDQNVDVILTGDFNEEIGCSQTELTKLMMKHGLIDVIASRHGYDINIATYKRGHQKLDYIFATRRVIDHILRCRYEMFAARLMSDHRAAFLDLSTIGLFNRELPILFAPSSRYIRGDHPSNITKYLKFLHGYIVDHKLVKKARELQHECNFLPEKANKLDELITAGMIAAKQICLITYRLPWCELTHEIMMTTNILKSYLSSLKTGINLSKTISRKMDKLKEEIDLPPTKEEANKLLRMFQKKARELKKSKSSYESQTYKEREKAFIEIKKDEMGEKKAKIIFRRGEDTKQMMRALPKTKKKEEED